MCTEPNHILLYVIVLCVNLVFFGRKLSVSDRYNNKTSMHGEKMVDFPSRIKRQLLKEISSKRRLVLTHHRKLASFRNKASKHASNYGAKFKTNSQNLAQDVSSANGRRKRIFQGLFAFII